MYSTFRADLTSLADDEYRKFCSGGHFLNLEIFSAAIGAGEPTTNSNERKFMSKKTFLVKLKPDITSNQDNEVVRWFSRMGKDGIPAIVEYADDGARRVKVVGLINETKLISENDDVLILHTIFRRYEMREADDGAFADKSSVEDFKKFKSVFLVVEK